MLLEIPPITNPPVVLSQNNLDLLTQFMGSREIAHSPWVALALVHPSFANEHKEFDSACMLASIPGILGTVGRAFLDLTLFHFVWQDPKLRTPGERDVFVSAIRKHALEALAQQCHLQDMVFVGKGITDRHTVLDTIVLQFLGAVRICGTYRSLLSMMQGSIMAVRGFQVEDSYKTLLQNHSQALFYDRPQYSLVSATGPDHQASFHVRVQTPDGKGAEGYGPSKKRAEETAACAYIEKYAPKLLQRRLQGSPKPLPSDVPKLVLFKHRAQVMRLCDHLNIPPSKAGLLSQALVHGSYLNETSIADCRDNSMLSQLGAYTLTAIVTEVVCQSFIRTSLAKLADVSFRQAREVIAYFLKTSVIAPGFDVLNLEEGLLLGKGQSRVAVPEKVKADTLQAILGAVLLARGSLDDITTFLSADLVSWIVNSLEALIADADQAVSPKTRLQEQLQAIGLNWDWQTESSGPDHALKMRTSIVLYSPSGQHMVIAEGKGSSNQEAESDISARASNLINAINCRPINKARVSEDALILPSFILRQEMELVPTFPQKVRQWHNEGLLGSKLLTGGDLKAFVRWANTAESLVCADCAEVPNLDAVLEFYSVLSSVAGWPYDLESQYRSGIAAARHLIEELDIEKRQSDIRESQAFADILDLSVIYRLLSREYRSVKLADVLDGFLLLRHGRPPMIRVRSCPSDIVIWELQGVYQTMLNESLSMLLEQSPSSETQIQLSISYNPQNASLAFCFESGSCMTGIQGINPRLQGPLWRFLRREIPITSMNADRGILCISCKSSSDVLPGMFASRALESYLQKRNFTSENEAISHYLHDLKNQLIAYQIACDSRGASRTSLLKSKYEASAHLDSALSLCDVLETIGQSVRTPVIEPVDIVDLFRTYVARKITTVPANIRIVPPFGNEECNIYTSSEFLLSILENIVKNSIEAMPNGGDIALDWIYDTRDENILIEIIDSGIGMEDELLQRLIAGERIHSAKVKGSGVGMFSVRRMLARIGGTLSGTSTVGQGTHWMITLPSLDP